MKNAKMTKTSFLAKKRSPSMNDKELEKEMTHLKTSQRSSYYISTFFFFTYSKSDTHYNCIPF
jgi:hypothetical protein